MLPREILKKVKQIEIRTRGLVDSFFGGEYHSSFKGRGMTFSEVREYQPGDDVRLIDWNVTARSGNPFIKVFEEERELTVFLLVDISSSGSFGSENYLKKTVGAEIASVLGFSAIKNNDKVGLILFSDDIVKYIPPKKGKSHVLRVIRELLYTNSRHVNTNNINVTKQFILPKTDTFTKSNLDRTLVGNMRFNINTLYTQIHDGYKWCSIKYNNTESQLACKIRF